LQASRVLSNHSYCLVAILVFSLIGWWQSRPAVAAVYECKAINGSIVLTNKPKGFRGCVRIETFTPSPQVNGAPPSPLATTQGGEQQDGPAMPIPTPLPLPPEGMQAGGPVDQSSAPSDPSSAPCPPGINPLSPLSGGRCTSTSPETPVTGQGP
jgi:hypothetical protein